MRNAEEPAATTLTCAVPRALTLGRGGVLTEGGVCLHAVTGAREGGGSVRGGVCEGWGWERERVLLGTVTFTVGN